MQIGILQTGHAPDELRPDLGDYSDLFEKLLSRHGFTFRTWNVVDMEFPDSVLDAEGWLVTGSRHGAYEDHPFIPPLEALLREIYTARLPLVGICFGHQIIAQALGGKVVQYPGGWAVGRQTYDWGGREVALNAWHQDQVVERPEGAELLATNAFCENAALLYGDRAFTVQAHPEFDSAFTKGLVDLKGRGKVPQEQLDQAEASLDQPVEQDHLSDMIATFFTERRVA